MHLQMFSATLVSRQGLLQPLTLIKRENSGTGILQERCQMKGKRGENVSEVLKRDL